MSISLRGLGGAKFIQKPAQFIKSTFKKAAASDSVDFSSITEEAKKLKDANKIGKAIHSVKNKIGGGIASFMEKTGVGKVLAKAGSAVAKAAEFVKTSVVKLADTIALGTEKGQNKIANGVKGLFSKAAGVFKKAG